MSTQVCLALKEKWRYVPVYKFKRQLQPVRWAAFRKEKETVVKERTLLLFSARSRVAWKVPARATEWTIARERVWLTFQHVKFRVWLTCGRRKFSRGERQSYSLARYTHALAWTLLVWLRANLGEDGDGATRSPLTWGEDLTVLCNLHFSHSIVIYNTHTVLCPALHFTTDYTLYDCVCDE